MSETAKTEARAAQKREDADIVELTVASALVVRDEQTRIPVEIYEHELPLLRKIYGPDFVTVTEERKVKVAGFDAETELDRLKRKYRVAGSNPDAVDFVSQVYRDGKELAQAAGVKYTASTAKKPAASVQEPARKDKVIRAS